MLSTFFSRPRVVFAALLATAAASVAFFMTERRGDPQASVAEIDRQLAAIESTLQRHTYELKDSGSPKPLDNARSLYRLSGPKGELIFVEGPADPSTSEVERIVAELYQRGKKQYVSYDTAWTDLQATWAPLTWTNRQIAEAKALSKFDSKPAGALSYDWDIRFRKGKSQWEIEEAPAFQLRRALYTAGTAAGGFSAVLLALAICGWLWQASLARIRELANAFRGK